MLTHRDLADLTAWLYSITAVEPEKQNEAAEIMATLITRFPTLEVLYLSNVDATAVFAVVLITIDNVRYLIPLYRGSYTGMDWVHDLEANETDPRGYPQIKRVHAGFYTGTPEAIDIILMFYRPGDILVISAHSLGAARAEIGAEQVISRGIIPHLVVTWGHPASFKPSTMPAPKYSLVSYRNNLGGIEVDPVTFSTNIRGYRHRFPFTDIVAPSGSSNPADLHHFRFYRGATPQIPV